MIVTLFGSIYYFALIIIRLIFVVYSQFQAKRLLGEAIVLEYSLYGCLNISSTCSISYRKLQFAHKFVRYKLQDYTGQLWSTENQCRILLKTKNKQSSNST